MDCKHEEASLDGCIRCEDGQRIRDALRYHVTGAIERGEAVAIVEVRGSECDRNPGDCREHDGRCPADPFAGLDVPFTDDSNGKG